jgi:lactoylglutathione lyase
MSIKFGHLCFFVKDVLKSQDFYMRHFNLEFDKHLVDENGKPFQVFLKLGDNTFLELWEQKEYGAMYGHAAFWVEDIHEFAKTMRQQGIPVTDPDLRPSGNTIAFLKDPDGNTIELLCAPR